MYLGLNLAMVVILILQTFYLILRCGNLAINYLYTNSKTKWRLWNQTNQLRICDLRWSYETLLVVSRQHKRLMIDPSIIVIRFRLWAGTGRGEAEELRSECGHGGSHASRWRQGVTGGEKGWQGMTGGDRRHGKWQGVRRGDIGWLRRVIKLKVHFSRRGSRHSLATYNSTTAMLPDSRHFR